MITIKEAKFNEISTDYQGVPKMKRYVVYVEETAGDPDIRVYFPCDADNEDHAEEQALNAYPNGNCITIFEEI